MRRCDENSCVAVAAVSPAQVIGSAPRRHRAAIRRALHIFDFVRQWRQHETRRNLSRAARIAIESLDNCPAKTMAAAAGTTTATSTSHPRGRPKSSTRLDLLTRLASALPAAHQRRPHLNSDSTPSVMDDGGSNLHPAYANLPRHDSLSPASTSNVNLKTAPQSFSQRRRDLRDRASVVASSCSNNVAGSSTALSSLSVIAISLFLPSHLLINV